MMTETGQNKGTNKITVCNERACVTTDLNGGAITDFHLEGDRINPLSFAFSKEQMPPNNKAGAPYQGHFLCLGRWGEPSEGEKNAGIPHHGQVANMLWQRDTTTNERTLHMRADSPLEGLQVERTLALDVENALYGVEEKVTNIRSLGRLYNMVQHPTLSSPFLDGATVVACNGTVGFDQSGRTPAEKNPLHWPVGTDENGHSFGLASPGRPYNSVFSFIVDKRAEYGWISAFSPRYRLLLGYLWRRRDYPWIHLWQHWEAGEIRYRGIEFGTAGIHRPFKNILETGVRLFGEKTVEYIDAGETVSRRYLSLLFKTEEDFNGMAPFTIENGGGNIVLNLPSKRIHLKTILKDFL
jgi:hypothetical protein